MYRCERQAYDVSTTRLIILLGLFEATEFWWNITFKLKFVGSSSSSGVRLQKTQLFFSLPLQTFA